MKKLTQLFLSMMLVLGVGTAFAQEGEGETPAPSITLPTPMVSPVSGSAVAPGTKLKITLPQAIKDPDTYMAVVVVYVENNDTVSLLPDAQTLSGASAEDMGMGITVDEETTEPRLWKTATYELEEYKTWMSNVVVVGMSDTAKIRMRLATITYADKNTVQFSEEFTAIYTIDPDAVQRPVAPTFSLQDGKLYLRNEYVMTEEELEALLEGMIESGELTEAEAQSYAVELMTQAQFHPIVYMVNGKDADFDAITDVAKMGAAIDAKTLFNYDPEKGIDYEEGNTIKAVTVELAISGQGAQLTGLSEVVTYPLPKPVFTPASGVVAQGTKITITKANPDPSKNLYPYYVIDGSDNDFNLTFEQLSAITNTNLKPYYEENMPVITSNATLKAAIALINIDLETVVWSDITTAEYTAVERPVAPTFNPDGGEISGSATITLTNGTEGDATPLKIYYNMKPDATAFVDMTEATLNSRVNPEQASLKTLWLYEESITITNNTPIHAATAKIVDGVVIWSEVVTKEFTLEGEQETPVAPVFNPDGGEIEADAGITITTGCSSCKIYYTTGTAASLVGITTEEDLDAAVEDDMNPIRLYMNSSKPTLGDLGVETPGATYSISAAAALIQNGNITWSEATTKEFTVKGGDEPIVDVATPVITPANDAQVHMGDMVTIICATEDAEIYYTTNGSAPYTTNNEGKTVLKEGDTVFKYTAPFALTQDMLRKVGEVYELRIRAVATKGNAISTGASVGYVVYPNEPTFSVPAGEVRLGREVAIACIPTQADIYYTTDGSEPTMETGTKYTAPIAITSAMTIKARAVLGQYQSAVVPATYTIKETDPNAATLTFNPASGAEVAEGAEVTITADKEVEIFYMMFSTAAEAYAAEWKQDEAKAYSQENKPVVSAEKTAIKAAYIRKDAETIDNEFFYASYTIKEPVIVPDTVKTPTFTPAGGKVAKGTKVTIACETENAVIYYTVDGSEPTAESTEYTAEISIDSAMTLKAIAVKEGMENSKVAEAAYTMEEVSNYAAEELQVNIYPNPSDGMFYIELPVEATIEVFATSGALIRNFTATAGKATLKLDRSGIYFVRITGEGCSTVKRVIVR